MVRELSGLCLVDKLIQAALFVETCLFTGEKRNNIWELEDERLIDWERGCQVFSIWCCLDTELRFNRKGKLTRVCGAR